MLSRQTRVSKLNKRMIQAQIRNRNKRLISDQIRKLPNLPRVLSLWGGIGKISLKNLRKVLIHLQATRRQEELNKNYEDLKLDGIIPRKDQNKNSKVARRLETLQFARRDTSSCQSLLLVMLTRLLLVFFRLQHQLFQFTPWLCKWEPQTFHPLLHSRLWPYSLPYFSHFLICSDMLTAH